VITRSIIICSDGTWNRPEKNSQKDNVSNVLRTARCISAETQHGQQQVFYDWGLGSYHDNLLGGLTGAGISKNITDAYRYLVHNYSPGTRLFFFGFSRGAYTIRALCGLINNVGILQNKYAKLIPKAWQIYKSPSKRNHPKGSSALDFCEHFCHPKADIDFVGVWDTVGALGIPFSLMGLFESQDEFYDTKLGSNIKVARQALAIDETREDFAPTLWHASNNLDLKQVWFAGSHSDVGGGYPPDVSGMSLSDIPLHWMLREAQSHGLVLANLSPLANDNHVAKLNKSRKHVFRLKKPLHRNMNPAGIETRIHNSVYQRYLTDSNYRPKNLVRLLAAKDWPEILLENTPNQ
jgi:uncharacterized protein (DUF2235 family)